MTRARFDKAARYPKSRLQKLGIKADSRVSVLGIDEPAFHSELAESGADVSPRTRAASDIIVVAMTSKADLPKLAFSETSSGLKMVVPLSKRSPPA